MVLHNNNTIELCSSNNRRQIKYKLTVGNVFVMYMYIDCDRTTKVTNGNRWLKRCGYATRRLEIKRPNSCTIQLHIRNTIIVCTQQFTCNRQVKVVISNVQRNRTQRSEINVFFSVTMVTEPWQHTYICIISTSYVWISCTQIESNKLVQSYWHVLLQKKS